MTAGEIEALTILVVQLGLAVTVILRIAEVFYNRCKREQEKED